MSAGVLLGAPKPTHALASKPDNISPTVGMSGRVSERAAVVTASGRALPALIYSIDANCWRISIAPAASLVAKPRLEAGEQRIFPREHIIERGDCDILGAVLA